MIKALTLAIAFCCLAFGFCQSSLGQQRQVRTPVSVAAESSNRQQDGLEGSVRRVRVETAKMIVKGGNLVEGPRVVSGIATYDPNGRKIDAVDYPVESTTLPGKERYRYDDKGNIVEMVVLGSDSSILSKESYEYEFDQLGNWTKMRSSVAVYENGKVTYEPTEVTYRTISYYYNQAIEKLSASGAKSKSPAMRSAPSPVPDSMSHVKATSQPVATNQPVAEPAAANLKDSAKASVPVAPTQTQGNDTIGDDPAAKSSEGNTPAGNASAPSVLKVAEDVLRNAAIDLPQPEYPEGALLARTAGKVEVQLLVDEKGNVTNARATSGNALLGQAAETAARKARFLPTKLSADATIVFGVLTYNFVLPAAPPSTNTTTESRLPEPDVRKPVTKPADEKAVFVETKPAAFVEIKPKAADSESATSHYTKGVAFLASGRYEEAAGAFNRAIQGDPNDANAYMKLAMSYSGMHKDKDAVAGYKMAAQIKKSVLDAPAYYMWAGSYLALDKPSEAISAFKQALYITRAEAIGLEPKEKQSFPSLEQLQLGIGIAYMNSRRFADAIKEFKQVVTLNPANAEAHYALAMAYLANGDRRAAQNQNRILSSLDRELAQKVTAALATPPLRFGCLTVTCRKGF